MIKTTESKYPAWLCPFCGGRCSGGSWSPDVYTECGAVEISHGEWLTKEEYENLEKDGL